MSTPTTSPRSSIRFRLALTYAGIALLSVSVLGSVLLLVLDNHFRASEDAYLEAVAARASAQLTRPAFSEEQFSREVLFTALTSQTRVRVYNAEGALVADSGEPADIDTSQLVPLGENRGGGRVGRLPSPLGGGLFAATDADAPRSDRVLRTPLSASDGSTVGWLLLSDGPASGRDVLASVTQVWLVAAVVAVVLAAGVGYVISGRISRPIVSLTVTSDRMADGDLGARSEIVRDDEVGRLATSFNEMADRIEATVVTLRRFVADAAHEIGTPLTALQADLELAEDASDAQQERVFVARALQQARRIEGLSQGLLQLSRLEADKSETAHAPVDLVALVRSTMDAAASRAEQAGLTVRAELPPRAVEVAGDEAKLQVLLDNLIDNALKFTPADGWVEVGVREDGGSAVLWVRDSGIGIPDPEQAEIFSRFYRARNVAAYPGSGLGLAIVQATASAHGGTVGLRSDESGTTFEVHLPLS